MMIVVFVLIFSCGLIVIIVVFYDIVIFYDKNFKIKVKFGIIIVLVLRIRNDLILIVVVFYDKYIKVVL